MPPLNSIPHARIRRGTPIPPS
ncbi:hypothetical protein YPPY95_1348, partial [Yersinia pestis PY-95]